jgi:hypothetical protein
MVTKRKNLEVLTVIHVGNYDDTGQVIDDNCPCCNWEPIQISQPSSEISEEPEWHLGEIWKPNVEHGIGAYFQVFHCQNCGLVYATHLN